MAKIGNAENVEATARLLLELSEEAKRLYREFARLDRTTRDYGLTPAQVELRVDGLEIAGVVEKFNAAKEAYNSQTVIPQ